MSPWQGSFTSVKGLVKIRANPVWSFDLQHARPTTQIQCQMSQHSGQYHIYVIYQLQLFKMKMGFHCIFGYKFNMDCNSNKLTSLEATQVQNSDPASVELLA